MSYNPSPPSVEKPSKSAFRSLSNDKTKSSDNLINRDLARLLLTLSGHDDAVTSVCFSGDSR